MFTLPAARCRGMGSEAANSFSRHQQQKSFAVLYARAGSCVCHSDMPLALVHATNCSYNTKLIFTLLLVHWTHGLQNNDAVHHNTAAIQGSEKTAAPVSASSAAPALPPLSQTPPRCPPPHHLLHHQIHQYQGSHP